MGQPAPLAGPPTPATQLHAHTPVPPPKSALSSSNRLDVSCRVCVCVFALAVIMLFQNPNYVPATLKGMVMTMFHEDSAGEEAPFGVVTFSGDAAARLPARGSAIVDAQVRTCT